MDMQVHLALTVRKGEAESILDFVDAEVDVISIDQDHAPFVTNRTITLYTEGPLDVILRIIQSAARKDRGRYWTITYEG